MVSTGNQVFGWGTLAMGSGATLFNGWDGLPLSIGFGNGSQGLSAFASSPSPEIVAVTVPDAARMFGSVSAYVYGTHGTNLTDLLGYLTSGTKLPTEEKLQEYAERNSAGLSDLIATSSGNKAYWEDVLEAFYIKSQFSLRARGIVELVTNGIDATTRIGGTNPVRVSFGDGEVVVEDEGSGMNLTDIFSKLLPPSVRDESDTKTIGRFGVGFYSILNYLNSPDDRVIVETCDGENRHTIVFARTNGLFNIDMAVAHGEGAKKGTRVTVRSLSLASSEAKEVVRRALAYNPALPIFVDGERINPDREMQVVNGGPCRIEYSAGHAEGRNGLGVVLVGGVVVTEIPLEGNNVPELIIFNMPPDTHLPISRNAVELTRENINAIRELMHHLPEEEGMAALLNGLWPLVEFLQSRNPSISASDDLALVFKRKALGILSGRGLFFPDDEEVMDADTAVRARVLHPDLYHRGLLGQSGVLRYDGLRLNGADIVLGDMGGETSDPPPIARQHGKLFIIDRGRQPETLAEKAIFASWLETLGLRATLPPVDVTSAAVFADSGAKKTEVSDELVEKYMHALEHLFSQRNPGKEFLINDNPPYRRCLETVVRATLSADFEISVELMYVALRNLMDLLTIPRCPDDHLEYVGSFMDRYIQVHRERTAQMPRVRDEEMFTATLFMLIFQEDPELSQFVEANLDEDNRRLFRIMRSGVMNKQLASRVMGIVKLALEQDIAMQERVEDGARAFLSLNDPNEVMKKLYKYSNVARSFEKAYADAPDEHLFLSCIFNTAFAYPMVLQDAEVDRRIVLAIRTAIDEALEYIATHDFNIQHTAVANRKLYNFLQFIGRKEGQDAYLSGDMDPWETDIHEYTPFVDYETDPIVILGYRAMDGNLGEVYGMVRDYGRDVARDFLYFLGSIDGHYYMEKMPPDVVNRGIRMWKEYILGLSGRQYAAMRDDIYTMFVVGADEVYMSPAIQPLVSLVLGEVKSIQSLDEYDPWRIGGDGYDEFDLSDHVRRYLATDPEAAAEHETADDPRGAIGRQFARRVVGQAINDQSTDRSVFARELLQNAVDEAERKHASPDERVFEVATYRGYDDQFVTVFSDRFGMTPAQIAEYLLIPGKSSKRKDRSNQIGYFGQGFFSIFKEAEFVTLRTRTDGGPCVEIEFTPVREGDRVVDVRVKQRIHDGHDTPVGTTIEVVRQAKSPDLDAAIFEMYLKRYGECLHESRMQVKLNGDVLNGSMDEIHRVDTTHGDITIYRGSGSSVLSQMGLYVKPLASEFYSGLPPMLKRVISAGGIVADLSAGFGLTRDRSDIINREDLLSEIQDAVAAGALRYALRTYLTGQLPLDALPYDLYKHISDYSISQEIIDDAEAFVRGEDIDWDSYVSDDIIQQFIVSLPVIDVQGNEAKLSLMNVMRGFAEGRIRREQLPDAVSKWLEGQQKVLDIIDATADDNFAAKGLSRVENVELASEALPEADAYWAYIEFADFLGELMNNDAEGDKHYPYSGSNFASLPEPFHARTHQYAGKVKWNLNYVDGFVELLARILRGEASDAETFNFWKHMIEIASHEQTHIFEQMFELTHDLKFHRSNRRILNFLMAHAAELDAKLAEMRAHYRGTFISAAEFLRIQPQ